MHGYGPTELANAFRTVRKNTLRIAEEIPEDEYGFSAAPWVRSVRELLAHIATAPMVQDDMHHIQRISSFKGYDFSASTRRADDAAAKLRSKAEIVAALKSEGDKFAAWLESLTPAFLAETVSDQGGQFSRT